MLPKTIRQPSLKAFLLIVNLIILAIPISGLYLFRIYQNELVRQTETELIAQAALMSAIFNRELTTLGGPDYGQPHWAPMTSTSLRLIPPRLDRSSPIKDATVNYSAATRGPDPVAMTAAANLAPVIKEATMTTLSTIELLDFRGVLVSQGRGRGLSLARNEEVAQALEGRYYSLMRHRAVAHSTSLASASRDTPYRIFVAMPVFNERRLVGVVCLSRTPRELTKALYQERFNLLLAGALILTLMIFMSLISSVLIVGPVKRLAGEAALVADDPDLLPDKKVKEQPLTVREVAELRANVLAMAERLRRRSDYLKAFAGGVSHEFKTPLSAIKGAMELLGEHGRDMTQEDFARFSSNISGDLERLERLVGRLLALAKAEAKSSTRAEKTEVISLIDSLAQRYSDLHPQLTVTRLSGPAGLEMAMARDVLETVILNLFDNSRESGAAAISVSVAGEGDFGSITVSDDGPGLAAGTEEKIFTPFFTTRQHRGGTGLGLSLARTLLNPYLGRLDYVGPPAVFRITGPLAKYREPQPGNL
ncbi:MAG: HAMP domain-containing histidine kinase [Deltaproteobacteria bacterium]|jgi:signal transduction histidine kinase|nr:HAMP domain-containing histidine kinase [Deltaproteobacteria bacterium]